MSSRIPKLSTICTNWMEHWIEFLEEKVSVSYMWKEKCGQLFRCPKCWIVTELSDQKNVETHVLWQLIETPLKRQQT